MSKNKTPQPTIIELAKGLEVHPSKLLDYEFGSDMI